MCAVQIAVVMIVVRVDAHTYCMHVQLSYSGTDSKLGGRVYRKAFGYRERFRSI